MIFPCLQNARPALRHLLSSAGKTTAARHQKELVLTYPAAPLSNGAPDTEAETDGLKQASPAPLSMHRKEVKKHPFLTPGAKRFKGPSRHAMSPAQRDIYNQIARTRTTGVMGPFGPWLANPHIAAPAQALGRVCRYETSLPQRQSEMVILMTAQRHNCPTEWAIHLGEARRAGLEETIIRSLKQRDKQPHFVDDKTRDEDQAIFNFTRELLDSTSVCDETYACAKNLLGDTKLVELTSIIGYYTFVAMTLNVFHIKP